MPILSYFSQGDSLHGALTLHPTDLTFDTDDVRMTAVAGSSNGRIFLAGGDGGVHELTYRGSTPASSASAGVADALLDGAASAASRVLGVEALRPHPKRAKRVDHGVDGTGGHPLITGLLRSIGGSMLAGPTPPPLLDLTVDHDRGLLYSLAADGCIRVFRIGGPDGPVEDALGPLPSSSSLSGGGLSGAGAPVVDAATSFTPCGVVADVEAAIPAPPPSTGLARTSSARGWQPLHSSRERRWPPPLPPPPRLLLRAVARPYPPPLQRIP